MSERPLRQKELLENIKQAESLLGKSERKRDLEDDPSKSTELNQRIEELKNQLSLYYKELAELESDGSTYSQSTDKENDLEEEMARRLILLAEAWAARKIQKSGKNINTQALLAEALPARTTQEKDQNDE